MENKCCATGSSDNSCATKKGCCWSTVFKGALVGGLIMFAYITASWMLFPWHKNAVMSFKNDAMVGAVVAGNVEKSGIYLSPGSAEKPMVFASVYQKGMDEKAMRASLYKELMFCLFAAALLTKLLKKSAGAGCPVFFSMVTGLLVASFQYLPNMIWHHFPVRYSLIGMGDDIVAITLAGLVISKIVLRSGACTMGKDDSKKGSCCH